MKRFLTYGEILMRLDASGNERIAHAGHYALHVGGAEANTAAALAQWGYSSRVISAVPANRLGEKAINVLKTVGVRTGLIAQSGEKMGLYFTEYGSGFKPAEVVYDRSDSAFSSHALDFGSLSGRFRKTDVFHWSGITPAVSEVAFKNLKGLLELANAQDLIITADLNYRSKLWKWGKAAPEVTPELVALSTVLITTEESVQKMLGMDIAAAPEEVTPAYYDALIKQLFDAYPNLTHIFIPVRRTFSAQNNSITLFGQKKGAEINQSATFNITEMIDRIGAGDAMMAGIIHGLSSEMEMTDNLDFALGASAYKHAIKGDFILASVEEIQQAAGGQKAKINR